MKIVFCHLLGDYVLQSDFIAKTKGKNMYHLWVHCMLYCLPFTLAFPDMHWKTFCILFGTHMFTDFLKAKLNFIGYLEDQIVHYVVALWLLGGT